MTSLQVICGLGPPNQKSWLRLGPQMGFQKFQTFYYFFFRNDILADLGCICNLKYKYVFEIQNGEFVFVFKCIYFYVFCACI